MNKKFTTGIPLLLVFLLVCSFVSWSYLNSRPATGLAENSIVKPDSLQHHPEPPAEGGGGMLPDMDLIQKIYEAGKSTLPVLERL